MGSASSTPVADPDRLPFEIHPSDDVRLYWGSVPSGLEHRPFQTHAEWRCEMFFFGIANQGPLFCQCSFHVIGTECCQAFSRGSQLGRLLFQDVYGGEVDEQLSFLNSMQS